MDLQLKPITSFRIKKIEIKKEEAIEQIKIIYDDDTEWSYGHDNGEQDPRSLIMTKGEYLVRITHEKLYDHESAGASVEFETNKGRIFTYKPSEIDSISRGKDSDKTTIRAEEGKEIVSLKIRRGVLVGSEQQPVPPKDLTEHSKEWYVLAYFAEKEDLVAKQDKFTNVSTTDNNTTDTGLLLTKRRNETAIKTTTEETEDNPKAKGDPDSESESDSDYEDDDIDYRHFHSKREAMNAWRSATSIIDKKEGRGALLIDCLKSTVIKKRGSNKSLGYCRQKAIKRGFCIPFDDEKPSIFDVILTLYKNVGYGSELFMFAFVIVFMFLNFSVGVQSSLLDGQILAALVTNKNDSNWRRMNGYDEFLCSYVMSCDGSYISLCQTLLISYIALMLFQRLLYIMNDFLMSVMSDAKTAKMGRNIFVHVLKLDKMFFDMKSDSEIWGSMNVESLHTLIFVSIPEILTCGFRYIIVSYYLITMDFYLGTFCVAFTTVFNFFIINFFIQQDIDSYRKSRQIDRVYSQITYDTLGMIKTVKLFAKEKHHIAEYDAWFTSFIQNLKSGAGWRYLREFLDEFSNTLFYCGTIYFGFVRYKNSGMTSGDFTGFIILFQQLHSLYDSIRYQLMTVGRQYHDIERYNTLKDEKPTMKDGTEKPEDIQGEIVFNDVKFSYPTRPKDKVLKNLNMTIKPHSTTAIVGESGAGKSTLAMLMTRMYDPLSGCITIDGHDMKTLDIEYLRSNIAIVDQNPGLFNRPLAENIAYGVSKGECTEEMIEKAGEIANCGFISKFREGYYTFAGYGGSDLSGGQRQRIAIARAAIRDPKILILDEATSSLDAENEKEVQEALEKLMKGRTVVVIAHRLSTIRNADTIICMKEGEVVEQGTHQELMKLKGAYHNLISQQILKDDDDDDDDDDDHDDDDGDDKQKVDGPVEKKDDEAGDKNTPNNNGDDDDDDDDAEHQKADETVGEKDVEKEDKNIQDDLEVNKQNDEDKISVDQNLMIVDHQLTNIDQGKVTDDQDDVTTSQDCTEIARSSDSMNVNEREMTIHDQIDSKSDQGYATDDQSLGKEIAT